MILKFWVFLLITLLPFIVRWTIIHLVEIKLKKVNKMKVYTKIVSVEMASSEHVYNVKCAKVDEDFNNDFNYYYDGDIDEAMYDNCMAKTKPEIMEFSDDVVLSGHGQFAGRKIHQVPTRIKNQIKIMLEKVEIDVSLCQE